jgi:hypothetical protein
MAKPHVVASGALRRWVRVAVGDGRRAGALLCLLVAGCGAVPSYVVAPAQEATPFAIRAVRESDGKPVMLRNGSFWPTPDPKLPDGGVRVRGLGRHSAMWKAGIALTAIGWTLAISGAVIGATGFSRSLNGCALFESCSQPSDPVGDRMLVSGAVIGPVGDLLTIIGPILATVAARRPPEEL